MNENTSIPVILYTTFIDAAKASGMTPEQRCEFYEGIMGYQATEEVPDFSVPIQYGLFCAIRPLLDENLYKLKQKRRWVSDRENVAATAGTSDDFTDENPGPEAFETTEKTTPKTTIINNDDVINDSNITSLSVSLSPEGERRAERERGGRKGKALPGFSLAERCRRFSIAVERFCWEYESRVLNDFYNYWSVPSADGLWLRFELEDDWNLRERIASWAASVSADLYPSDCPDTSCTGYSGSWDEPMPGDSPEADDGYLDFPGDDESDDGSVAESSPVFEASSDSLPAAGPVRTPESPSVGGSEALSAPSSGHRVVAAVSVGSVRSCPEKVPEALWAAAGGPAGVADHSPAADSAAAAGELYVSETDVPP